jgi:thiamine biosynthesis protein ThiS
MNAAPLRVRVNGEDRVLPPGTNITGLLQLLNIATPRVAVERNREIVPKARYADTRLVDGDELEVVEFVGGG